MGSETGHVWKKLNYFKFTVFFLFTVDDVKNEWLRVTFL